MSDVARMTGLQGGCRVDGLHADVNVPRRCELIACEMDSCQRVHRQRTTRVTRRFKELLAFDCCRLRCLEVVEAQLESRELVQNQTQLNRRDTFTGTRYLLRRC